MVRDPLLTKEELMSTELSFLSMFIFIEDINRMLEFHVRNNKTKIKQL